MPKKSIREEILAKRKHLALDTCLARSLKAQESLVAMPEFIAASTVGLYSPIHNEVFTEEIFRAARAGGRQVVYPRVSGGSLEFVAVEDRTQLKRGAFGVLEPSGSEAVMSQALDLLVVPGVAFDLVGYRLGYGKGFYDRVLHGEKRPGLLVGLCFELQLVAELPFEAHDVKMDRIVTEDRILDYSPQGQASTDTINQTL